MAHFFVLCPFLYTLDTILAQRKSRGGTDFIRRCNEKGENQFEIYILSKNMCSRAVELNLNGIV